MFGRLYRDIMNFLLQLCFIFVLGSSVGWLTELLFRRMVHKKWINPGLFAGPYLPIYGLGLVCLYCFGFLEFSFIKNEIVKVIVVSLSFGIVLTFLEFITGIIFIHNLKIKLWDYSKEKGNILGIICPKFFIYWSIISGIYYFLVHPLILNVVGWFENNLAFSFVIGLFFGFFITDIVSTFKLVKKIKSWAKEHEIVVKYEKLKESIKERKDELAGKVGFFLAFKSTRDLTDELRVYMEEREDK